MQPPKIVVHHLNNSKSQRIVWVLEELGLDYDLVHYKRLPYAPPEMRQVHPLGKAPIVEIDGVVMAESGAVVEYLVDRHGAGKLGIDRASPSYGHYLEMLHYPEGSLNMPVTFQLFMGGLGVKSEGFQRYIETAIPLHLDYVSGLLKGRDYLIDNRFTAVDLQISFNLQLARSMGLLTGRADLLAYLARLEDRPAYKRAIERGGSFELKFG